MWRQQGTFLFKILLPFAAYQQEWARILTHCTVTLSNGFKEWVQRLTTCGENEHRLAPKAVPPGTAFFHIHIQNALQCLYMTNVPKWLILSGAILVVVLAIGIGYSGFRYYQLSRQFQSTTSTLASTTADLQQVNDAYTNEQAKSRQLGAELAQAQQQNGTFAQQFSQISATVGTLSKLAATDPELLAKYSKVYFLSDNYVPAKLSNIDSSYVFGTKTLQFESEALPFLKAMIDAASASGNTLRAVSTYRSFGTQALLKSSYKVTYGKGTANSFSADQGYSEHQLGTAVDFTTPTLGSAFTPFNNTPEYAWLVDNAYRYGFILSYTKSNPYYVYEPWHWRFVGVKLATMLHAEKQDFYSLDQRTINPYLISLFDPITNPFKVAP
jgi:D-alanyl-D-alanine carboxypeptidase